jgi:hypothetical protein
MSNNQSATPADQDERAQWNEQWNEWSDDLNAFLDWIDDFAAANPGVVNSRAILHMAQHAYVAGRKVQREIDAARRPVGQASAELFAAARDFYNETVADPTVRISCASPEQRDVVTTAGERLRTALSAPPAKAVDLAPLVSELAEADREYAEAKKKYHTVSAKMGAAGGRASCKAAYDREVTAKARLDAAVRALIDSMAVGND